MNRTDIAQIVDRVLTYPPEAADYWLNPAAPQAQAFPELLLKSSLPNRLYIQAYRQEMAECGCPAVLTSCLSKVPDPMGWLHTFHQVGEVLLPENHYPSDFIEVLRTPVNSEARKTSAEQIESYLTRYYLEEGV